jgi:chromosome segregation ATPase
MRPKNWAARALRRLSSQINRTAASGRGSQLLRHRRATLDKLSNRRDSLGVTEDYVPTPTEIWDFLVGLKEATESGFLRMESRFTELEKSFDFRMDGLEQRMDRLELRMDGLEQRMDRLELRMDRIEHHMDGIERRLVRIDDRLASLEDLTIRKRLDDHEGRIASLEHRNI